jgi:hypothetical protein
VSSADNNGANFVMTLSQKLDCSNHIELAFPAWVTPIVLSYSPSETNYEFIYGWTDIFKNDNEAECGAITRCKVNSG